MKKPTLLTIILILTLTLSACGGKSELDRNRDKWDSSGVTHYRFELSISCFCPFMDIVPVVVEVKDGAIVSMIGANGQPLSGDFRTTFEKAATVEGLFAIAEDSLSNADQVEITYDALYGFPASILVDWIKMAADDEISYYIGAFKALD
jgi:hypothetical protein